MLQPSDILPRPRGIGHFVRTYGPDFLSTYGGGALLAASAVLSGTAAPLVAIPAAAGLVSFVNQMDHNDRERALTDFYRDQLASVLQKNPSAVTPDDLHDPRIQGEAILGNCPNNIIRAETVNNDRRRNFSIAFHAVSAGLFGVLAYGVLPFLTSVLSLPLAQVGVGLGGLLLFQQIDHAVSDIGRAMFDLHRKTAHENIVEISEMQHRGQRISPLQVFNVMVCVDKDLSQRVEKEMGERFEDLYLSDKYRAVETFGTPLKVQETADELNRGAIEAEDLALIVCHAAPAVRHATPVRQRRQSLSQRGTPVILDMDIDDDGPPSSRFQDRIENERHSLVRLDEGASMELH